jgi:hypothetical protein
VAEFWRWWAKARDQVAVAIAQRGELPIDALSRRVDALDPALEWEFAAGATSRHALIVSTVGDPKLRRLVAAWLAAAPPSDATWEYHGARQPNPNFATARLGFDGHDVELAGLRYAATVDGDHGQVDVEVYHPVFAAMDHGQRLRIAFMSMDWLLGEEAVESWIGALEVSTQATGHPLPPAGLVEVVDELSARYSGPVWSLLNGERDGLPTLATVQRPLRGIRWPRFDTHVAVTLRYSDQGHGFPGDEDLVRIRAAEDYLTEVIGSTGALLAHETGFSQRVLHYYVDPSTDAAARLGSGSRTFQGTVTTAYDPDLGHIQHLA